MTSLKEELVKADANFFNPSRLPSLRKLEVAAPVRAIALKNLISRICCSLRFKDLELGSEMAGSEKTSLSKFINQGKCQ